jgi:lysozyme
MRQISEAGIQFIEQHEGLSLKVYLDSVKIETVGYGHKVLDADHLHEGSTITLQQAGTFLGTDLRSAEAAVEHSTSATKLNDNEFAACVSLAFNIGANAFKNSHLARILNAGDHQAASNQFKLWNHAGGHVVDGLTTRRADETKLFLTPC